MKQCTECFELKPLNQFNKAINGRQGLTAKCKPCIKRYEHDRYLGDRERRIKQNTEYRLMKWYGITVEQYDEMFDQQAGRCAICSVKSEDKARRLAVDADHTIDPPKVRQLLCVNCNTGIGNFMHDPALVRLAADYLDYHNMDQN